MNHKDLEVWKKSIDLAKKVYLLTQKFPKVEIYGIVAQMRRAAVSIPSNIAEGSARKSDKEFIQFLYVSLGSLAELETQMILSNEIGFIEEQDIGIIKVRSMLLGLIKYLTNKK
jgi:four helix bundle protein